MWELGRSSSVSDVNSKLGSCEMGCGFDYVCRGAEYPFNIYLTGALMDVIVVICAWLWYLFESVC